MLETACTWTFYVRTVAHTQSHQALDEPVSSYTRGEEIPVACLCALLLHQRHTDKGPFCSVSRDQKQSISLYNEPMFWVVIAYSYVMCTSMQWNKSSFSHSDILCLTCMANYVRLCCDQCFVQLWSHQCVCVWERERERNREILF